MKRTLKIERGIIPGDMVRDILEVFPEIDSRFRARKTYDEYYFHSVSIELTIDKVESLSQSGYTVCIGSEDIVVS